jgi:hypothetical protein
MLKYLTAMQLNWSLAAVFLFYMTRIISSKRIDNIFNKICIQTIVNSTRNEFCPNSLIKNNNFYWKSEIMFRKSSNGLLSYSSGAVDVAGVTDTQLDAALVVAAAAISDDVDDRAAAQSGDGKHSFSSYLDRSVDAYMQNKSSHNYHHRLASGSGDANSSKLFSLDDVYLLLISIALINFFVSLVVQFLLVKARRRRSRVALSRGGESMQSTQSAVDKTRENMIRRLKKDSLVVGISMNENEDDEDEEEDEDETGGFANHRIKVNSFLFFSFLYANTTYIQYTLLYKNSKCSLDFDSFFLFIFFNSIR